MRNKFLYFILLIVFLIGLTIIFFLVRKPNFYSLLSPVAKPIPTIKYLPLEKYSFLYLRNREYSGDNIILGKILNKTDEYTSYMFYFKSDGKKVSGMANIPNSPGTYPVIAMFRGFVDISIYETGIGTKHGGEYLASHGFITLAPDFLGYGESASPSAIIMEERFETYTTAMNLLSSIKNLNRSLETVYGKSVKADTQKIGIWGHSNGGHISMATLEISGVNYPTVLWAPVSKPFPYSILFFTDEYDDHGKALRKIVADFEKDYDVENYSVNNYYNFINAPIQLHQGGQDEAVPQRWSDDLNSTLKKMGKRITYYTYPKEDHNFSQGDWSTTIERSVNFYTTEFSNIK
jgi:uncharacterized protein